MGSKSKYLICRLCLSYGEVLVDICEGDAEPGFEVKETIEDLLRVEVVPGGDLPWLVCLNCIGKLEDFSNFKFKCLSSNSAFVQRFNKPRTTASAATSIRQQQATRSPERGRVDGRPCAADEGSQRVVVVSMGGDSGRGSDRRTSGGYAGVSPQVTSKPPEVSKRSTTMTSSSFKPVAIAGGVPSGIKAESDGGPPVGPLRQMGGSIVIVSTTPTAVSTEGKALYFKGDDPREVVQSELDDEMDDLEDEDRKEGIFIGRAFDHDASGEGGTNNTCGTSPNTANLCPPQPATRLVVYTGGGIEGGGGGKRALSGEDDGDSMEMRLDKMPPGDLVSRADPLSVLRESPLERKRRMARERQRRFRARQSSEMAWRRAQDRAQLCKRQWTYEQQSTANSGDEGQDHHHGPKTTAYHMKL